MAFRALQRFSFLRLRCTGSRMMSDKFGSGEGKGGGSGGSIRSAGGAFGEMEAAREEEYFRRLQAKQLQALHDHVEDEVHHTESEIDRLENELEARKRKLGRLRDQMKETKKD